MFKDGGTPLFVACQYGHLKMIHLLLQHGAKVNASMKVGNNRKHLNNNKNILLYDYSQLQVTSQLMKLLAFKSFWESTILIVLCSGNKPKTMLIK